MEAKKAAAECEGTAAKVALERNWSGSLTERQRLAAR